MSPLPVFRTPPTAALPAWRLATLEGKIDMENAAALHRSSRIFWPSSKHEMALFTSKRVLRAATELVLETSI
ncbi:hypothetical protein AGIG_G13702 [Arapaima gigas]